MASDAVVDIEALIAPISDERPAGCELKDDSELSGLYYQIKDAREAARIAERRLQQFRMLGDDAEETDSVDPPDWRIIRELGVDILCTKSKDVWVAAWLIEALCREYGFAGLRDGFRVTREIVEKYWDGIHPEPDEDDGYSHTVAQLAGLNGEEGEGALIMPIEDVPICNGRDGPLSSTQYKEAAELEQVSDPDVRARRIDQGALTISQFENAVKETPLEFLQTTLADIVEASEEFRKLDQALEQHCGNDSDGYSVAPPTSHIRTALDDCRLRVESLARDILGAETGEVVDESEGGDMTTTRAADGKAGAPGKVVTRDDAFRALLQVADFFRRTEPHSPVSYALEQAVRWGRMSLPDLLSELVPDDSARREMFVRAGIPQPPEAEE